MTIKTCFVDASGFLCDYKTGDTIRRATTAEQAESESAGATGAFACDTYALGAWAIHNTQTGADFGIYAGATEADALDAMARDAGYVSHAAACEVAPAMAGELRVEAM